MSDIPANILAAQAAGRIPDGVSLEYLAQSGDGGNKVGVLILGCLALAVVMSRCYARIWLIKKMGRDDALAILTMVLLPFSFLTSYSSSSYPRVCQLRAYECNHSGGIKKEKRENKDQEMLIVFR